MYAQLLFLDPVSGSTKVYEYSTVKSIQQTANNLLATPVVKASYLDSNKDGRPDEWNVSL
jgi:hypothetical protein